MTQVDKKQVGAVRTRFKRGAITQACVAAIALAAAGHTGSVSAGDFTLDNGINVQWTLGTSIGASWRAGNADPALIGVGNGGLSGAANDDGNLNYGKGAVYSTVAKVNGELKVKKDNFGAVIGTKAWYDYAGKNKSVPHGSFANGYVPDTRLDDSGFDSLSKFSGIELDNAYAFGSFNLADKTPLSFKLGNHVVNWGESVFIPGINQFGTFDITAANRPGAQVKEILLPIPQLSTSLALPNGVNLEAFYQLKWKKNILDGCGTYWSLSDSLNCPSGQTIDLAPLPDQALFNGGFSMGRAPDRKPKNGGQFGLAGRYMVSALDTEFGAYFVNSHTHSPNFSLSKTPSPLGSAFGPGGPLPATQYFWDYSAENIKAFGLTASTAIDGWSLSGEASYTKHVPVQINPIDLIFGTVLGAGPQGGSAALPPGSLVPGYDLKNKTQLQISTVKIFPRLAGAESLTFIGEVGYQHWAGIGDPATSTRYGRSPSYGFGETSAIPCAANLNANPDFCENKGYATTNAWGYRVLFELSYPNVLVGVNLKPRLFWSHDVKGYSADGTFSEDRQVLGLGLHADYNKQFSADFGYTTYNKSAKYDSLHDRDNFSVVVGFSF